MTYGYSWGSYGSSWGGSSWGGSSWGASWGGSSHGGSKGGWSKGASWGGDCDYSYSYSSSRGGKSDKGGWDKGGKSDKGGWDKGGNGGWGDWCDPAPAPQPEPTPEPTPDPVAGCPVSFVIEGEIDTRITLTELSDGSIQVDVEALDGAVIGDLRGFFFDIGDESLLSGMTVAGDDVTRSVFDADGVRKTGNGNSIQGDVLNAYGKFDGGIEFGTQGIGRDDIRATSFTLSSTEGALTVDMFSEQDFALRYTSVGDGDRREDSLKIGGTAPELVKECDLGSIGDYVWLDFNRDGIQDADEIGLEGFMVELYKNGVATGDVTFTDANGFYLFEELTAGDYRIKVSGLSVLQTFTVPQDNPLTDDLTDSDVDASGMSGSYSLAAGEDYRGLDAGVVDFGAVINIQDDAAGTCADELLAIDVLGNDGTGLIITQIDGMDVEVGGTVTLASGAEVTLNEDGTLTYDGVEAWADVLVGMSQNDAFSYTVTTALGGTATADVDAHICGAGANEVGDFRAILEDPILTGPVQMSLSNGAGGGFRLTVESAELQNIEVVNTSAVWCVDQHGDAASLIGVIADADVFLADANDASLGEYVVHYENLDLVNYILNQDYATSLGAQAFHIQYAIWSLTDGDGTGTAYSSVPIIASIIEDAMEFGENFTPDEDDLVGLILAPVQETYDDGEPTNYQNFIYGVEWSQLDDCLCY